MRRVGPKRGRGTFEGVLDNVTAVQWSEVKRGKLTRVVQPTRCNSPSTLNTRCTTGA